MDLRLPPFTKNLLVIALVGWAIGTARSGDPRNPDLAFVGSLAKQGADASIGAAKEAVKLIPSTSPATASQPTEEIQPRQTSADIARTPVIPEPTQPIAPSLMQQLGCSGAIASVTALNQQTLTVWLTRAAGYPRATLAALHEPRPGLQTPAACVSPDQTHAIWLVTFGGNSYQKLTAHFDSHQQLLRYDPLTPVAIP